MKTERYLENGLCRTSMQITAIVWVAAMLGGGCHLAAAETMDSRSSEPRPLRVRDMERFLEHPTSASADRAEWMRLVEQAAVAAFEAGGDSFSQSQSELDRWMLLIERSPIGNRSQRATVCSRILNGFHRFWMDKEAAAVRESLGSSRAQITIPASTMERESARFAEGAIRLNLAASALEEEDTVRQEMFAELDEYLRNTEINDGLRRSIIAHLARAAYSANAPEIGVSVLGADWRQRIRANACTDTIGAAFFVFWHGAGDRVAAAEIIQLADDLVRLGRIPADHSSLRAVHDAYYRGLLNTRDQLLLQAAEATPASSTTAKSKP